MDIQAGIYKHIRTGQYYRTIMSSFDVASQTHHIVYMHLETGQIFNRREEVFIDNFQYVANDPQKDIQPKEPKNDN